MAIRIVLADDNPKVRAAVRLILEQEPDLDVVGEASNGSEAFDVVQLRQPDVLVMDVEMPGLDGLALIRRLRDEQSSVKVLVFSAYEDGEYISSTFAGGAAGYLVKGEAPEKIVDAIRQVAEDGSGFFVARAA